MASKNQHPKRRGQLVTAAPRGHSPARGGSGQQQQAVRPSTSRPRMALTAEQVGPASRPRQPTNAPQPDTNDTRDFLEQLHAWAATTVKKNLDELMAEFARLQSQPKPEPSQEFVNNPQLNRYRDVLCIENNRAMLNTGRYIHANWIDATNGERRFMCTQGPLPHTVDDFWSLVAQERIEALVMLCDTVELGRPKCHQYWPEDSSKVIQTADAGIRVAFANQEQLDGHLFKTRLQVTSTANSKQPSPPPPLIVRHFHWRHWPDRGVPVNHLAALRLLHYLGPYKRVLVHCSAGIGRTGTIVAIYLAQDRMRAGQQLDLFELVRHLRQQRAGSVQSLDQYLYIYSVLLRYASNKAERGHILLNTEAANALIQAIARRIYRQQPAR